ncbi:hypothetical protein F4809DRAFT_598870 [Biscogniauxia mediterranea]|nr:hypothetical protein F4809DRAFT_598870 [Biscogniauxia mediterranea]
MRLSTTTYVLTAAGVALAHVPQPNEPRQPMITPPPALRERQTWEQAVEGALDIANAAQGNANKAAGQLGRRDVISDNDDDWQGVVSSAQSVASSWADQGDQAVSTAQSIATSLASQGGDLATSLASQGGELASSAQSVASSLTEAGASFASSAASVATSVVDSAQGVATSAAAAALSSASAALDSAKSVLATATGADQASASSAVASASSAASAAEASGTAVPDNAAPRDAALSLLPVGVAAAAVLVGAVML